MAKAGVVQEVIIETKFVYTAEIDPQWEPTNYTSLHSDHEKTVTYRLDLDAKGNIIDGEWILMVDGGHYTFQELYDYYATLDENGDGNPDLDKDQVEANMWHYFEFQIMSGTRDEGNSPKSSFRQNPATHFSSIPFPPESPFISI